MLSLRKGRYAARLAETPADILAAQRLRYRAFRATGAHPEGTDADAFDRLCRHVLVEETRGGTLVCCFRLLPLKGGAEIGQSYSAQYYELSALAAFDGPMVEMGRFCIHPDWRDPDILRVAWGAMTRFVDEEGVEMLFGCSSFRGTEAETYMDAFALLQDRHLAPKRWLPRVKAPNVFRFGQMLRRRRPDARRAMLGMPPLLRSYLAMGGWVSDHAVVDRDLNTLHVFTGLEIRAIPPSRKRLLRAAAG
ncbi:ornithine-acyl-ACP acyltransferase [Rhodovulum sulfidophilum]|uniref:L-ornithine N(alpha)-acyltransferase n=1 Tax=Rhodovulum sulfidophilum TaxID=35806 RepID=A0A0D6B1L8_RHOSU|nr:GNAT family N-acetyltransferase [Rhodovulum sulfidophilum]ANB35265.1 ornithine-acyl-ACP acyltransferase [Rhodovulum sulfidophilum DSM 1374]ANB39087.1 ornithine-acyl-ACP acyltransferase [Rhodovulum sulfidophilum]MBK5923122.1 ornithine-acyl-ACP acyltransferase [Rhodovulum sulfidophilum]MCW2303907.1 putative hemolysin [Rhodovulum sulfidophilum]BAQ68599.1 ornithine-acyl[acyl carrier protein]N-acyltransferase [Rhodovulum sulfidophilum]